MAAFLLVLSTVPSQKEARQIASVLLEKKVAACINITSAVESHYRWKGKREKGREVLLFIKTRASLFSKLEKILRQNHPYSVPEIIAVPIVKGSAKYLNWVRQETQN